MPRQAKHTLNTARIKALNKPGRYADAGAPTLALFVREGANGVIKSWVQRLTINGVRRDIGLGAWPLVTLAKARTVALDNRRAVHEGRDPVAEKRRERVPTFADAAKRCIAAKQAGWKNDTQSGVWTRTLEAYAVPAFSSRPINTIAQADVLKVLVPLWQAKPAQAKLLRQRIRAVFAWGQAHNFVESNPAGEGISAALPKQAASEHHTAMPWKELPAALAAVVACSSERECVKACFAFQIATATRPVEAREAKWTEIDLDAKTWTIPASRMKMGREHRVPLNTVAIDALERAQKGRKGDLVFHGGKGTALPYNAQKRLMSRLGLVGTSHGFRSSFRDWCAENGKPREIAEAALAHVVGGVEGAYFRTDLFKRRAQLMDDWARYLMQERGKVVELTTAQ